MADDSRMPAIERLAPQALGDALRIVLATASEPQPARKAAVRAFVSYLRAADLRCDATVVRTPAGVAGACVAVRTPGGVGLVLTPPLAFAGIAAEEIERLVAHCVGELADAGLHYAQALLEPEAVAERELLERAGFQRLADLLYLERDAAYPWTEPVAENECAWVRYGPATHDDFARTIARTYVGTRDCPELAGVRSAEDALAGHRATGAFDAALWELLIVEGEAAGCLLLTRVPGDSCLEVVYMGLAPSARGAGRGALLMRRALDRCREAGARRLIVTVDEQNEPALALYKRFGLEPVSRRVALWRPLSPARAARGE